MVVRLILLTAVMTVTGTVTAGEIRALDENECREMLPVVTSKTQSYNLPAVGSGETLLFGEDTIFKYTLQSIARMH